MSSKIDSQFLKTINERRLLNLVREEGPISRNDLAKRTKISKSAVSEIINRLDQEGFILEIGKGESTSKGGKRPILIKLNSENGYVIGIQITRGNVHVALADLKSNIKQIEHLVYEIDASIDVVISNVFEKIDSLLVNHRIDSDKLLAIGIAMPGFIDHEKGELKYSVTLREWINLSLSSRFSERYQVPTILENDVNAITMSESLLGAGRGYANLVCLFIESGIGAGIIIDGQIVRGETTHPRDVGYLELGHHIANIHYLENLYNNQRYFGEILSEVNLLDTLRMKLHSDSSTSIENSDSASLESILALGEQGNGVVQEILNEYAYPLAVVCMNIVKIINPGLLILSGHIIENSNYLFNKVHQLVKQSMINVPIKPGPIVMSELGDRAGVSGAIVLALKTIFDPPMKQNQILQMA